MSAALDLDLTIRPATADDLRFLWECRNDPESRANSRNTDVILWDEHVAWATGMLADPDRAAVIGMSGQEPAGTVRFDRNSKGVARISIIVAPAFRGCGIGSKLLERSCTYIAQSGFADVFEAEVKAGNRVSRRLFEALGFEDVSGDAAWSLLRSTRWPRDR